MTITDTPPEATTASADESEALPFGELGALVGSGEHARIGRLFLGFSLLFAVAALVAQLLVDLERISADGFDVLTSGTVFQVVTAQQVGLVFGFALPALLGLALIVVPLQVGAHTIAFPRAANLAFWGWLLGSVLVVAGYLVGGGPGGTDLRGTDLWLAALILVVSSLVLGAVCVVTTVLALRAPGMTMGRTPMFSFSMFVAGSVWILTLPVLAANLLVTYLDHRNGQVLFGVNENLWPQLRWAVGQPQIYVVAIPVLGIVADVIPVFAGVRQRLSGLTRGAIGAFAVLAIGAWAQPAFAPGVVEEPLFIAFGLAPVLPVLLVIAIGADTLRIGRPHLAAPLLLALVAGLVLLAATAAGAVHVIEPLDLAGTTWATGQVQLTVLAALIGLLAGLQYWSAKVSGRLLPEGAGRLLAPLALVGALLSTVPLLVAGALEQSEVVPPGAVRDGVEALNLVATVGTALVLLVLLGVVAALVKPSGDDEPTPEDPWGGHTLEWATASPPARGNFAELPVVTDASPLFTESAAEEASSA